MNRMFAYFCLIFCEVGNHFIAVRKILGVKEIVLVFEGLNIINLHAIYELVTGPEQPRYVVLCVQNGLRKGAKIRNQYNQVPHLTKDTKWESNNHTISHRKRESRGQSLSSS